MEHKRYITVFCGGESTEHDVSIRSAHNVVFHLKQGAYHVHVIYVDQAGRWHFIAKTDDFLSVGPKLLVERKQTRLVTVLFGQADSIAWRAIDDINETFPVDCVFPLIHGRHGEDGCLQGLFECLGVPYVGANVASSAICMSKVLSKRLLRQAGLPVLDDQILSVDEPWQDQYDALTTQLGGSLFIKPIRSGSSVGTQPVHDVSMFHTAMQAAFRFDREVIVEPLVLGQELECAVIGDHHDPQASVIGEIILDRKYTYYSYDAKYLDEKGAQLVIPAVLPEDVTDRMRALAVAAFQTLYVYGMARVDFFLTHDGNILINELNTIPGFTDISMYPKLLIASGFSYEDLLVRLIDLAFTRHQEQQALHHSFTQTCLER